MISNTVNFITEARRIALANKEISWHPFLIAWAAISTPFLIAWIASYIPLTNQ